MKEFPECMDYVLDRVGEAALHEQLAEECVELAHAALKKARILRGENPTPVSEEEADCRLLEEFEDVMACAAMVNLSVRVGATYERFARWAERIEKMEEERKEKKYGREIEPLMKLGKILAEASDGDSGAESEYWSRVCEVQKAQAAKGLKKYGMPLEENGKLSIMERLQHLEEELVDALMYIEWAKEREAGGEK